jgi:hypothetical protein
VTGGRKRRRKEWKETQRKKGREKRKKIGEKISALLENMICNFTDYIIIK